MTLDEARAECDRQAATLTGIAHETMLVVRAAIDDAERDARPVEEAFDEALRDLRAYAEEHGLLVDEDPC